MPNRLATQTSPYLRQHADNPVHWWPWCAEALALARAQDTPILLSIGYSACHWCHVMAHESFADAETARVMNELFVCIKVDREERPDLDKIYQLAHQALTRRGGGWPLTVFLTPDDHLPFYAGTYFPREPRYGMPPFEQVLRQARGFWDQRREEVRAQNLMLGDFLRNYGHEESARGELTAAPIRAALAQIEESFDAHFGGHVGAPKFPHCPEMELLLDLDMPDKVEFTLVRMREGGIHDQLGGGFCRYSVDARWEIPHFEKMLYDNAQLLPLFALAMRANEDESGARPDADVANGIYAWLQREMTSPEGGFYAALDADSEHEEGKFYVWRRTEVESLLRADEFAVVAPYFGFDRPPNFERHAWNLIIARSLDAVAQSLQITANEARTRLASAQTKLFKSRAQRVRPGLDDKILTAWNALMISGLARAARTLRAPAFALAAERALVWLHREAWRDGRLYAKTGAGSERFPAYLDDHAFLLDALLELLQCRWRDGDLAWAIELADALLARFEDSEHGGFFFTAHDHEALIQRPRPFTDEAAPSGNGVAAHALLRLGHLLGEPRYLDAAERTLRAAWPTLQQMPQACCTLLRALNDFLQPRTQVVIRFDAAAEEQRWREPGAPMRRTDIYLIPAAARVTGMLAAQKYTSGGVAYICRGISCQPPVNTPDGMHEKLQQHGSVG